MKLATEAADAGDEAPRGVVRVRSAAVRTSILAAARTVLLEGGFDATGIREIAELACVNPAIVIRHFGSKDRLFVLAVDAPSTFRALLDGPLEDLGRRVLREIVRWRSHGLHVLGTLVRASGKPAIRSHVSDSIVELFAENLTMRIRLLQVRLHAHLFAAQLVGLMSTFTVYDDDYLTQVPDEDIISLYGDAPQRTLTGVPPLHTDPIGQSPFARSRIADPRSAS